MDPNRTALDDGVSSYEDRELVEVIFAKTALIDDEFLRLFPTAAITQLAVFYGKHDAGRHLSPVRVLDFGGACGHHFLVAKLLGVPLRWAVVETPAMADRAAALNTDDLRFFSDIDEAQLWLGAVDLMHSSGALQYTPEPERFCKKLLRVGAPVVAWARMNLTDGPTRTVQQVSALSANGPGPLPPQFADRQIEYACTILSETDFMEWHAGYHPVLKSGPEGDKTLFFRRVR